MTNQHTREEHNEGMISAVRVILLGLCMDAIYQWIVPKTFYPAEAVIVAIALAYFAHLLLRGPIARVTHWRLASPVEEMATEFDRIEAIAMGKWRVVVREGNWHGKSER